jgi:Na+-driven multidrug efflux pump
MAFDAVLVNLDALPGWFIIPWLVINFSGFLVISCLAVIFGLSDSSEAGVLFAAIAGVLSGAFWAFVLSMFFRSKEPPNKPERLCEKC